jgi:hypothetical protein
MVFLATPRQSLIVIQYPPESFMLPSRLAVLNMVSYLVEYRSDQCTDGTASSQDTSVVEDQLV